MNIVLNEAEKAICKVYHIHMVQFTRDSPPIMGYEGTRQNLMDVYNILGFKRGAEIGVQRGHYSNHMCQKIPDIELYCIDSWEPFTVHSQKWQDRQLARAHQRLDVHPGAHIIKKRSVDAAKDFEDGFFDFVYIDAMHFFDDCMMDILTWVPKVKRGGIIAGHDYEHFPQCGVPRAVDAYCGAHGISTYFITPKDPPRSWMFVKP